MKQHVLKPSGARSQVGSVERALTILELLADRRDGLTASDLSRRARIPKSTLSYILRTLVGRGYVRRDVESGLHTLGIRLLSLGGQAMQSMELREVAMPHLRQISERTRLDAHLAILDHGDAVYIERVESPGFIKMATWIGRRMTPHITAVGKALICQHEKHEVQEIFKLHHIKPATPKTITTLSHLLTDLADTRRRGFSIDDEENEARVRCIAAPVVAATGEVVAAIGVSGTVGQIDDEGITRIGNLVRSAALRMSAQLGGSRRK